MMQSMKIWATFGRGSAGDQWRLQAMSVLSPERARALAEREQLRTGAVGTQLLVREYESAAAVPWTLDSGGT
jgi:hypothetical protein